MKKTLIQPLNPSLAESAGEQQNILQHNLQSKQGFRLARCLNYEYSHTQGIQYRAENRQNIVAYNEKQEQSSRSYKPQNDITHSLLLSKNNCSQQNNTLKTNQTSQTNNSLVSMKYITLSTLKQDLSVKKPLNKIFRGKQRMHDKLHNLNQTTQENCLTQSQLASKSLSRYTPASNITLPLKTQSYKTGESEEEYYLQTHIPTPFTAEALPSTPKQLPLALAPQRWATARHRNSPSRRGILEHSPLLPLSQESRQGSPRDFILPSKKHVKRQIGSNKDIFLKKLHVWHLQEQFDDALVKLKRLKKIKQPRGCWKGQPSNLDDQPLVNFSLLEKDFATIYAECSSPSTRRALQAGCSPRSFQPSPRHRQQQQQQQQSVLGSNTPKKRIFNNSQTISPRFDALQKIFRSKTRNLSISERFKIADNLDSYKRFIRTITIRKLDGQQKSTIRAQVARTIDTEQRLLEERARAQAAMDKLLNSWGQGKDGIQVFSDALNNACNSYAAGQFRQFLVEPEEQQPKRLETILSHFQEESVRTPLESTLGALNKKINISQDQIK